MANEKNKLYITITDERGGGDKPTPKPSNTNATGEKEKSDLLGRYVEHELFHLVKNQTMQAVNYSLSNIGNFTGDYITQKNVNVARQAISSLIGVGVSTVAGAKVGGLVGAIIGFAVGTTSLISSSFYNIKTNTIENAKNNYGIEQLKQRSGLNTILDGSRGTEN